ncbi:hypothetical protein PX554_04660 [Sphingomonas sp. H39-1-10]|uniref:hypothetical protein n=1 Tax=Sphingomonas TaxID=13687 RepID=UPI0008868997|nr:MULTISPECIES: hypothetical protein [Sphingomonas]MDF0487412.1 hypothetical protein [Sphingomonas pollutisoli]SDA16019.1 hypothetical protein SAMN03159340_00795 [Sphingomonas sp. NFR15]
MNQAAAHYEVIFALDRVFVGGPFRWSWVRIGGDGLVAVRGKAHETMRAAIDEAARHRRDHGGGEIRVNLKDTPHEDARDVTYLA